MVSPQHLRDLPAWTGGKLVSCDKRMAEFRKAHPCSSTLGSPGRTVRRVEKVKPGTFRSPFACSIPGSTIPRLAPGIRVHPFSIETLPQPPLLSTEERLMRKLISILLLALCAAVCIAADAPQIAGKWQFALKTPQGSRDGVLTLQQDGAKLSG